MDADSVVKANKIITYWNVWVFDEKQPRNKIKTILFKKKADMTEVPLKNIILEQYFYDVNGNEVKHDEFMWRDEDAYVVKQVVTLDHKVVLTVGCKCRKEV